MGESTFSSAKVSLKRKALIMLLISTMTTMSSASIFMIQDAEASRVGLRVLVQALTIGSLSLDSPRYILL